MKEAAINLVRSSGKSGLTMDQFVEEMRQLDHVTDEEAIERYRDNESMQYRRIYGAIKAKGNRMIQESKQGNFAFFLPLNDGGVIEIDNDTVISFRFAERCHLLAHRQINAEKRAAKIAILNAADQAEGEQIQIITSKMLDGDTLSKFDDGQGNAAI